MVIDESLLLQRCRAGDNEAFDNLIERYRNKVYSTAFRMMGNYHDASDCTQEVFLRVYRSIGSFRGDSSFSTWIYHITVNVCKDELRKNSRHNAITSIDELVNTDKGELKRELPSDAPLPEELYEQVEVADALAVLINQLEPNYRLALLMREHDDLSYQEIADILGTSIGTVKSRISRARAALKKKIIEDGKLFSEISRLYNIKETGKENRRDGLSEVY